MDGMRGDVPAALLDAEAWSPVFTDVATCMPA
jgi:hypothetical protein